MVSSNMTMSEAPSMAKGGIVDDQGKMNNFAIEPRIYVDTETRTGFTEYAERLNGRLAMIGFISLIATEILTGEGLVSFVINNLT